MKHIKDCEACQDGKLGFAAHNPEIMDYSAHSTESATWGRPYPTQRFKNPWTIADRYYSWSLTQLQKRFGGKFSPHWGRACSAPEAIEVLKSHPWDAYRVAAR